MRIDLNTVLKWPRGGGPINKINCWDCSCHPRCTLKPHTACAVFIEVPVQLKVIREAEHYENQS